MKVELAWEDGDRLVVTCSGQLGWDAQDDLVKRLQENVAGRCPQVILDLESVDFITSAGLGSILQVRKHVLEAGGRLVLAGPSRPVEQLLKTVGLDRHIPIVGTLASGREFLAQSVGTAGG